MVYDLETSFTVHLCLYCTWFDDGLVSALRRALRRELGSALGVESDERQILFIT